MFSPRSLIECNQILEQGCKRLAMSMGIVSHIQGDDYQVISIYSQANVFVPGETFQLQSTYCRDVIKAGKTIAIAEINGEWGMKNHPLYNEMALEAFVSTPIFYQDEIFGTLNFSDLQKRETKFSQSDIRWLENIAKIIAMKIEK